jgi:TATA-box binding protein (TBP) (component of TFIID and TFIIIB)
VDLTEIAKNIDPELLARNLNYEELVEKVSFNIYEEISIDYDNIVSRIDASDIAEHIDLDDIAKNIDISEHIDLEEIVENIDYKEIVKEMMATLRSR